MSGSFPPISRRAVTGRESSEISWEACAAASPARRHSLSTVSVTRGRWTIPRSCRPWDEPRNKLKPDKLQQTIVGRQVVIDAQPQRVALGKSAELGQVAQARQGIALLEHQIKVAIAVRRIAARITKRTV